MFRMPNLRIHYRKIIYIYIYIYNCVCVITLYLAN
jgi:hypothetical protein